MIVWITKYALTQGIQEKEAEKCESSGMIQISGVKYSEYYHREGDQWHKTLESAQKKAEEMRERKIKALRKQLKKLEELTF